MILPLLVLAVSGSLSVQSLENPSVWAGIQAVADTGKPKPPARPTPQTGPSKLPSGRPSPAPQPTGDPRLKRRKPPELPSFHIT